MELLLVIAFVGLVALWLMHERLAARVAELERLVDLSEETAPPQAQTEIPAASASQEPPPVPSRPIADMAALVGAAPAEPDGPHRPSAAQIGGWFERYVGGRLLIWIGGIALAVAGVLIVRFSVGLITPPVRLGLATALGVALIVGGEVARRGRGAELDPRIAQSLVGAGILILYAAPYGALILYQLISNGTCTALMVAVTGAALLLSLRHGPPTAVMGLIGGFAIPYLVGDRSQSAIPLLVYLGLLDAALFGLAGRRGWTWLAAAASLVSFGWMIPILFWTPDNAIAGGAFILGLSLTASLIRVGRGWQLDFMRPVAIGLTQLAILVARNDLGLAAWGLFGALSFASFFLSIRRAEYRLVPPVALAAALILLAVKAALFHQPFLPWMGLGIALLFAAGALAARRLIPRPYLWTLVACVAAAGPPIILRLLWPELGSDAAWALVFLVAAVVPFLFGGLGWREGGTSLFVAGIATALLLSLALREILPADLVAPGWMAVGLLAALAARQGNGRPLASVALLTAAVATFRATVAVPALWNTLAGALAGIAALATNLPSAVTALEALLLPALILVPLLLLLGDEARRRPSPLIAVFLLASAAAYILFKQAYGLSTVPDFVARGFAERMLITQAMFLAGWAICSDLIPLPRVEQDRKWWIGISFTALAAARLVWFDMLVDNPLFVDQSVGALPVANWLAPAFLLSAFWLYTARRSADAPVRSGLWLILALAALILGIMLMVRQGFQGAILSRPGVPAAESYGYSLAGLLLSIFLLLGGIRLPDKALRLAGLVLLTATALKVFLIDASALAGVLRILSFLGLGVALIGIGKLYTAVLNAEAGSAAEGAGETA